MLNLSLSQTGNWRLIYYQLHVGDKANRNTKIPMIEVIELPITVASRILAVGASYLEAPPSWYVAGYFYQEVQGIRLDDTLIFPGVTGGSGAVLDASKRRITLNTIELHIFNRLASEHSFRFEAMRWIPRITLGVWEYLGTETDSTEDLIQTLKVDLTRLEVKVDNL
ncbi:MAG: hypothetical protein LH702_01225 [Phormidesmis sp. CAN_BIN44]|nr:hypothetical protein [Phormidesmis sp. CAN_BIN44]